MAKSNGIYIFLLMIFFFGLTIVLVWRVAGYKQLVENKIQQIQTLPAMDFSLPQADLDALKNKNQQKTGNVFIGQLAYQIEKNLRDGLGQYVTDYQDLEIDMAPFASEEIQKGYFKNLRISMHHGKVRLPDTSIPELPFDHLDFTIRELVLDLDQLKQKQIVPAGISAIVIHDITLDEKAINEVLRTTSGRFQSLQVAFQAEDIQLHWKVKPPMAAIVRLKITENVSASDQLLVEVKRLQINGLPVPLRLTEKFIAQMNPLLPLENFENSIQLGAIQIQDGKLGIGLTHRQD